MDDSGQQIPRRTLWRFKCDARQNAVQIILQTAPLLMRALQSLADLNWRAQGVRAGSHRLAVNVQRELTRAHGQAASSSSACGLRNQSWYNSSS